MLFRSFRLLMIRPWDVPTYVENGSADLGIVGHDVLQEQQSGLTRLLDLKFGACKLVLAGLHKTQPDALSHNTVIATKYPTCTERYFQGKGIKVNILKLYGAIELAPLAGLSDIICDLTATGKSLKENNLYIIDTLFQSTATLVSNPTSLKIHYNTLTTLCKQLIQA